MYHSPLSPGQFTYYRDVIYALWHAIPTAGMVAMSMIVWMTSVTFSLLHRWHFLSLDKRFHWPAYSRVIISTGHKQIRRWKLDVRFVSARRNLMIETAAICDGRQQQNCNLYNFQYLCGTLSRERARKRKSFETIQRRSVNGSTGDPYE